jgi:hypothetical protein
LYPPQFLKAGSCLGYITSVRTAEKIPSPAVGRVVFYAVRVVSGE